MGSGYGSTEPDLPVWGVGGRVCIVLYAYDSIIGILMEFLPK